jgi:hypothetical protein
MKPKSSLVWLVALVLGVVCILPGIAGAQSKDGKPVLATAKKGTAGADANIKSENRTNAPDAASKYPAPADKGGTKTRGGGWYECGVHVDNHSPYYVQIFVDGDYSGTVAPWGDYYAHTGSGATSLYGRALFDDGSVYTWGPQAVRCPANGWFLWQLNA